MTPIIYVCTYVIQLLAGVDTTSYTTAFLLYHLALNPEEQERLREESGQQPSEGMKNFRRGKMALKESLRLNPISVGVGRISDQDAIFSGNYFL